MKKLLTFFVLIIFCSIVDANFIFAQGNADVKSATTNNKCDTCGSFYSESLGVEKNYRIFLPPSYDKDLTRKYPVLYLLHGYNFARNDPEKDSSKEEENHWIEQEKVVEIGYCGMTMSSFEEFDSCLKEKEIENSEGILLALQEEYPNPPSSPFSKGDNPPSPPFSKGGIKEGLFEEMIIVMPDGDSSFYINRKDRKPQWPPLEGDELVDGIRKGATGMYEDYIVKDLVEHIDETYKTIADRRARFIGGFSMGGIGSISIALKHQDVYSSVSALSLIFNFSQMVTDPFMSMFQTVTPEIKELFFDENGPKKKIDIEYLKEHDPYEIAKSLDKIDLRIYFDGGSGDFYAGRNDFKSYKGFAALLDSKGVKHYPANHVIEGTDLNAQGVHTGRYWMTRLPVILKFHSDSYKINKK